jgi:hypothetical protein
MDFRKAITATGRFVGRNVSMLARVYAGTLIVVAAIAIILIALSVVYHLMSNLDTIKQWATAALLIALGIASEITPSGWGVIVLALLLLRSEHKSKVRERHMIYLLTVLTEQLAPVSRACREQADRLRGRED